MDAGIHKSYGKIVWLPFFNIHRYYPPGWKGIEINVYWLRWFIQFSTVRLL